MQTNIDEIKHKIRIRESKSNVLKKLEVQAAGYGMACPAHIQVDIENIKREIEELNKATLPRVRFEEIWVEQNIDQDDVVGMLIHIPFYIHNRTGFVCSIFAEFYNSDGSIYYSLDENYQTEQGQLFVSDVFEPKYTNSVYKNFKLFVPYNAIHDSYGHYNFYFIVKIYDPVTDSTTAISPRINVSYLIEPREKAQNNSSPPESGAGVFVVLGIIALILIFTISECSGNSSTSQVNSGTNTPNVTQEPTPIPISADQFIRDYFAMLNTRQYDRAWSMLSTEFKELGKYYGNQSIENFANYWNTIDRVAIEKVDVQIEGFDNATVFVTVRYQKKDKTVIPESVYIDLIKDKPNNSWIIRQIRSK